MDTDLMLTAGIILLALSLPALLNAFSSGRPPRGGVVVLMIAAVLIVTALVKQPSGYSFSEIPDVMLRVFHRLTG